MKKFLLEIYTNKSLQVKVILLAGIILVIFAPYLFTLKWGWREFDSQTSAVGDTIGGITAPIVNLISAILVYYAFTAQIEANRLLSDQIEKEQKRQELNENREYFFKIHDAIKEEINLYNTKEINFDFSKLPISYEHKIILNSRSNVSIVFFLAIWLYSNEQNKRNYDSIYELLNTINLFETFLEELGSKENNITLLDRKYLYISSVYIYDKIIKPALLSAINTEYPKADLTFLIQLRDNFETLFLLLQSDFGFTSLIPSDVSNFPTPPSSTENPQ